MEDFMIIEGFGDCFLGRGDFFGGSVLGISARCRDARGLKFLKDFIGIFIGDGCTRWCLV
ncbi:hypothetical protein CEV08_06480 [Bartonella tribocorum]|uniref:Uncharacterized protein n=1 Tax=Bartonella tribocorum TaxID=85701 RepID=A0A2M6UT34_9HYPH|nr:hypothetical protein [Bartonella tribocorum]PIT69277.1 hypothetical protein CEV08_06480 [Bartonella tribocorum]